MGLGGRHVAVGSAVLAACPEVSERPVDGDHEPTADVERLRRAADEFGDFGDVGGLFGGGEKVRDELLDPSQSLEVGGVRILVKRAVRRSDTAPLDRCRRQSEPRRRRPPAR